MFKKAIVIGCPGAGKSTFSRQLRDRTGLPLYYLDIINHKPDRTTVSREEFDRRLAEIMSSDRWIIDGNYNRTLEMRFEKCDAVFLLDFPTEICLAGAAERIGKKREDMPWTENELDGEFKQWILDFPRDGLPKIYELISKYRDKRSIYIFRSREDIKDYFEKTFG